jgi:phosphate transport system ATP-binding protein
MHGTGPMSIVTPSTNGSSTVAEDAESAVRMDNVSLNYGTYRAVKDVTLSIPARAITAIIGSSGSGKSTLLRAINRINDQVSIFHVDGHIFVGDMDVYADTTDPVSLRQQVGMVFQRPNPFPMSIYDNVAFGPRLFDKIPKSELNEIVEWALGEAGLWDEVKDKLSQSGQSLSGGQQQRLCIARAIATHPEVLLMDEPCSALDPISTVRVEELMMSLKRLRTIVIVTHNMQQAARASDYCFLMHVDPEDHAGYVVEFGPTEQIFGNPQQPQTKQYVAGKFG